MKIKVGDRVKVLKIPPAIESMGGDEMQTGQVFKKSVGQTFTVASINEIGWLELELPNMESIWIEPEFVALIPAGKK